MRRTLALLLVALAALLWSPPTPSAQNSPGGGAPELPNADLAKPYAPVLGDLIALSTSQLITALKQGEGGPTIAVYDRDARKVLVITYGAWGGLDHAKASIDQTRKTLRADLQLIGPVYHVALQENAFAYAYYYQDKELVHWQDGKYSVEGE